MGGDFERRASPREETRARSAGATTTRETHPAAPARSVPGEGVIGLGVVLALAHRRPRVDRRARGVFYQPGAEPARGWVKRGRTKA
jgi:hypothetical protein